MKEQDRIDFVSIYQPRNVIQAGMIRNALQEAGIICHVDNEHFSAVRMGGATGSNYVPECNSKQGKRPLNH